MNPLDVPARSIRALEPVDFDYAKLLDCTIRQISRAEKTSDKLFASVQPTLVHRDSPLAGVEGGQNLVMSTGKFGGETVFAGHGAGGNPTAVAVVSDLIAIQRSRQINERPCMKMKRGAALPGVPISLPPLPARHGEG